MHCAAQVCVPQSVLRRLGEVCLSVSLSVSLSLSHTHTHTHTHTRAHTHSFWMKTDLVVVSVSLILQLALYDGHGHGAEPGEREADFAGLAGLLILVRLPWRVIRIVHAVIVTLEKAHQDGEAEEGAAEHGQRKKLAKEGAALGSEAAEEGLRRRIAELTRANRGLEESNAALSLENRKLQEALTKLGQGPAILLSGESVEVSSPQVSRVEAMALDSENERARRGSLNG